MYRRTLSRVIFFILMLTCGYSSAAEDPADYQSTQEHPKEGFVSPQVAKSYDDMNQDTVNRYEVLEANVDPSGDGVARSVYNANGDLVSVQYADGRDVSYQILEEDGTIQACELTTRNLDTNEVVSVKFIGNKDGQVASLEISTRPQKGEAQEGQKVVVTCKDTGIAMEDIAKRPIEKSDFFRRIKAWKDASIKSEEATQEYKRALGVYCDTIENTVREDREALKRENVNVELLSQHILREGSNEQGEEGGVTDSKRAQVIHETILEAIPPPEEEERQGPTDSKVAAALLKTEDGLYDKVKVTEARCAEEITKIKNDASELIKELQQVYVTGLVLKNDERTIEGVVEGIVVLPQDSNVE